MRQVHALLVLLVMPMCGLYQGFGQIAAQPSMRLKLPSQSASSGYNATSPKTAYYYDQRERVSARLTFEWFIDTNYAYFSDSSAANSSLRQAESEKVDNHHITLHGRYLIERMPQLTRMALSLEMPLITVEGVRKSYHQFHADVYYLGKTGEIVLCAFHNNKESVSSVSILKPGTNGFGLPVPYPGLAVGTLVFLAGISPLRLMDAPFDDWKLIDVNENEWVFELAVDAQKRARFTGMLQFDRIEAHLSRRHGDAPARLEVVRGDFVERWQTLEYTQVQGVWLPQKVLYEYKTSKREIQTLYRLKRVQSSSSVIVDIPQGTPVLDWRERGRAVWIEGLDSIAISLNKLNNSDIFDTFTSTRWSAELERSLQQYLESSKSNQSK